MSERARLTGLARTDGNVQFVRVREVASTADSLAIRLLTCAYGTAVASTWTNLDEIADRSGRLQRLAALRSVRS